MDFTELIRDADYVTVMQDALNEALKADYVSPADARDVERAYALLDEVRVLFDRMLGVV